MTKEQLTQQIKAKGSYLCVGLDTDPAKLPRHILRSDDPVFEFNKQIIDATARYAVAYKPNIAFYEALGPAGWESLQKTMDYIPQECFTIADAKRGDIGNTSRLYATAFFETLGADAITVAPYMGHDSVLPFLEYGAANKWVILLAYTSNSGSKDFQKLLLADSQTPLYEQVIAQSKAWGNPKQLMYVVGATHPAELKSIRASIPDYFLLVPGVGAQGGSLQEVSAAGLTGEGGLLVNSSRGIIYASQEKDFAHQAAKEAAALQQQMEQYLSAYAY